MTKADLIKTVHDEFDGALTKANCVKAVNAVFSAITGALENNGEFAMQGFGSFKVQETASRVGRNPRTGEQITIPAGKRVKFVPAKALKESVQG